jgi:uncharacterized membrane protein YesL
MAKQKASRPERDDFFEQLDKWASFILANMLWLVLALPVVTMPAATAGLFAAMSRWARGKPPDLFPEFFGAMRRHWKAASILVLLDVLVGGLLALNLSIFPLMDMAHPLAFLSRSVTVFVSLALGLINLYAWPLMVTLDMPLRLLLSNSIRLAFAHPFWSFGVLVAALLPLAISLLLPAIVWVMATFSATAFIMNWGAWRIIRRYLPDEER